MHKNSLIYLLEKALALSTCKGFELRLKIHNEMILEFYIQYPGSWFSEKSLRGLRNSFMGRCCASIISSI